MSTTKLKEEIILSLKNEHFCVFLFTFTKNVNKWLINGPYWPFHLIIYYIYLKGNAINCTYLSIPVFRIFFTQMSKKQVKKLESCLMRIIVVWPRSHLFHNWVTVFNCLVFITVALRNFVRLYHLFIRPYQKNDKML